MALLNRSSNEVSGYHYQALSKANAHFPIWVTLTFALLPSIKLATVDFGFSFTVAKVSVILMWIYLGLRFRQLMQIRLGSTTLLLMLCCFFLFFIGWLASLFFFPNQSFDWAASVGSIVWYFIYPISVYILVINTRFELRAFSKYLLRVVTLCFLGYVQLALFFLGINTSYEAIGEPAFENVSSINDVTILRVNSVFGEPRDLAVTCMALAFLLLSFDSTNHRKMGLGLILLALLTLSSSAILCLIGAGAILFLTNARWFVLIGGVGLLVFVTGINFDNLYNIGRLGFAFEVLNSLSDLKIPAAFNEQSVDLLAAPFILDAKFLQFPFVFGSGFGGEHDALVLLHDEYTMSSTLPYEKMSSRLIWFTFWLETGVLGVIILLFVVYVLISKVGKSNSKDGKLLLSRRFLLISLWCSVQSTGYFVFFVIAVIGLLINDRNKSSAVMCIPMARL